MVLDLRPSLINGSQRSAILALMTKRVTHSSRVAFLEELTNELAVDNGPGFGSPVALSRDLIWIMCRRRSRRQQSYGQRAPV